MQISVSEAKAQLTDLVRRAEAGDEVILTRRGEPTVRLVPVSTDDVRERRRQAISKFYGIAKGRPQFDDVEASRIADFLYDEHGLPA